MNESRGRRTSERPEPGSPEWYRAQAELIGQMVESVSGVTMDGERVEIDAGQVWVHHCQWNDFSIPVIMHGVGGEARPLYFVRAYAFHPGAAPIPATNDAPAALPQRRSGRAFVVDTGWQNGEQHPNYDPAHVDPCEIDVVHGHGPAIVGLIDDLAPDADVQLRQVAFNKSSIIVNNEPVIPIFRDPISGSEFRGFTESSLVATLEHLKDDVRDGNVVNLSLGAVACPDMMANKDPVGDLVRSITSKGAKVVVAAGNHRVDVPSWPAAYATGIGGIGSIPNVFSVGAGENEQQRSDFSAHGAWVTTWRDGQAIRVNRPNTPKLGSSDKTNFTWSGTSFAAPRYAAELLPHVGGRGPRDHDWAKLGDQASGEIDVSRAQAAERLQSDALGPAQTLRPSDE